MSFHEAVPIPGFPGYFATPSGDVWSTKRREPQLLSTHPTGHGHLRVNCQVTGRNKRMFVHRLILLTFRGEPPDGCVARHLNDVPDDNRLVNLAWGTPSENAQDREVNGGVARGERSGAAKLNSVKVLELRRQVAAGATVRSVAEHFGISEGQASRIARGQLWAHLGGAVDGPLHPQGEDHPAAKLSNEDVDAIRLRHPTEGTTRLARTFGVSTTRIKDIVR